MNPKNRVAELAGVMFFILCVCCEGLEAGNGGTVCNQGQFASGVSSGDQVGWSVAIDGNTAVIGAPMDDDLGSNSGSARIYSWSGSSWIFERVLLSPSGGTNQHFGSSVAISGDVIVIGETEPNTGPGAAYVFRRDPATGVWGSGVAMARSDPSFGDWYGASVSVSGDVAVVGSPKDITGGIDQAGSAYVFRYDGSAWIMEQKLVSTEWYSMFGGAVAVDGNVIVVGAERGGALNGGSAFVYELVGAVWTPQALPQGIPEADEEFGGAVAVLGSTILVGAPTDQLAGSGWGSVYVYQQQGPMNWVLKQQISPLVPDSFSDFGSAVTLGLNIALIGARQAGAGVPSSEGAIYVFDYNLVGANWVERTKLNGAGQFGISVSLSDTRAVVGAYLANGAGGAAYGIDVAGSDCDGDGLCDTLDCNSNGILDACETLGGINDCDGDTIPDDCEPDCDGDGVPDDCEADCDSNGIPDDCELDCDGDGVPDVCEILQGSETDLDGNGVPDNCDPDCDGDGLPDIYEISVGLSIDCNSNGIPDGCDITDPANGIEDCNGNGVPDSCDYVAVPNSVTYSPASYILEWSDAADDANSGIVSMPFVGGVNIGGVVYTDFVMDSNGYVELLRSAETPYNSGFGYVNDLINASFGGNPTHTYLMAGYDDLISNYFGVEYGYDIQADRIVFYWNTETFCDLASDLYLEMQIVLVDDGTVQWHFIRDDGPCFDYDLFSGIYLGHDLQVLHQIARGYLPVGQSWNYSNIPFSSDANGNGNPDECDFTSKLFSLSGPGNGTGWSWCVTGDYIGTVCNNNVTGVTGTTLAVAEHFANSINSDPTLDSELFAQAIESMGTVYLSVRVNGVTAPNLCVGLSGGPTNCCPIFLINDCAFNPSMQEIPITPLDCNGNQQSDTVDIVFGVSQDTNSNGIPDECEPPLCPADITPAGPPVGNGVVNIDDLVAVLNAFGPCPAPPDACIADITPPGGNGVVNIDDLVAVLNAFGVCP